MPGLSLAFPHIYIHRNSICPHWKYSAQCVYRQSFFSVCGLCRWPGWGSHAVTSPSPLCSPTHVGTLTNAAACPVRSVTVILPAPTRVSAHYRQPSVQRNPVFQRTPFLLSCVKYLQKNRWVLSLRLSGFAHRPCPYHSAPAQAKRMSTPETLLGPLPATPLPQR